MQALNHEVKIVFLKPIAFILDNACLCMFLNLERTLQTDKLYGQGQNEELNQPLGSYTKPENPVVVLKDRRQARR